MQFIDDNVNGADVSFYQDDNKTPQQIDFNKMAGQNASFVIIRAGQNVWVDPDFTYNWENAKRAGLPRGSYWFYDDRVPPEMQAELFSGLFASDKPELDLWIDIEKSYGGAYPGWQNWKKFLNRLKQLTPNAKIGIYTGYYYITEKIPSSEFSYFSQFPLWLAWYNTDPSVVKIPQPWTECLYWQWGTPSWGIAWGCESIEIDMNKFNGTLEQFKARYGLGGIMEENKYYKVLAAGLNIRSGPVIENNIVGTLSNDDIVNTVAEQINGTTVWKRFHRIWRGGKWIMPPASPTNEHWSVMKTATAAYLEETINPEPSPSNDFSIHITVPIFMDIDGIEYIGIAENIELTKKI